MDIFEKMTRFVQRVFKTNLEIFLEALKLSPNAQGYVSGSITELLLKKKLEEYGFEVKRILEKWEGKKHPRHHGDFYFRDPNSSYWYVIESKGLKSNSEKWHRLYNFENLKKFLIVHADKIPWISHDQEVEQQVVRWIYDNLPKFKDEYSYSLYEYQEIQRYKPVGKTTKKAREIAALSSHKREDINAMIEERLNYVMSRVKVLETHFVSGTSRIGARTQATPRIDEFNVIAVDIFLRYPEHKFLFANPKNLEPSGDDPNHLQQNYIIGFVFTDEQGNTTLSVADDWYEEFRDVFDTLSPEDSVKEEEMQVDNRYLVVNEDDE